MGVNISMHALQRNGGQQVRVASLTQHGPSKFIDENRRQLRHKRSLGRSLLKSLNDIPGEHRQWIVVAAEASAHNSLESRPPDITPTCMTGKWIIVAMGHAKHHRSSIVMRDDVNASSEKWSFRVGLVDDAVTPGQQHPVPRQELRFGSVDAQAASARIAPQQHPAFHARPLRTFTRTELIPAGQHHDLASIVTGGSARLASDGFIHVFQLLAMAYFATLLSNTGMTSSKAERDEPKIPFRDSTPLISNRTELLRRADEDGFLFFKRFLPLDDVLALRREMLGVVDHHGWRKAGQDALGGLVDLDAINRVPTEQMRTDIGVSIDAYDDAQRLESLHRFPHHPRLLALFKLLFDRDVLVHPRHMARMITGHRAMIPTPPHQDFPLVQGTMNTWTCWIPVGDCPRAHGGLTVLRGSHKLGYVPIQHTRGAGGIAVQLCPGETAWAQGDYEAGDLLTFPSLTIHKALKCRIPEMIRLSLDVRYQPVDQPVEEASLKPHCELSWDDIYANWKSDRLKYYWKSLPLQLIPWDDSYTQPKRRIC